MKKAVTVLLFLFLLLSGFGEAAAGEIPYGEFKRLLKHGQVEEVVIGSDTIHGYMKGSGPESNRRFETVRVGDPDLIGDLQASRRPVVVHTNKDHSGQLMIGHVIGKCADRLTCLLRIRQRGFALGAIRLAIIEQRLKLFVGHF